MTTTQEAVREALASKTTYGDRTRYAMKRLEDNLRCGFAGLTAETLAADVLDAAGAVDITTDDIWALIDETWDRVVGR